MKFLISSLVLFAHLSWANTDCSTRYPIVLSHGLFGYSGSIGIYPYWSDIPDTLRACGATVYVAHVSAANETSIRGEQLFKQLQEYGHERYHLIGHSHGGLDARYVLENYPDMVASVTTIGTPHRGSKVADKLSMSLNQGTWMESLANLMGNALAYTITILSGHFGWQDTRMAMLSLTTERQKYFNHIYRIGLGKDECSGGDSSYFGTKLYSWGSEGAKPTTYRDWFGHVLQQAARVFDPQEKNDGLVAVCSMKWGKWLGSIKNAHHLIPVGGIVSPLTDDLDGVPQAMFVEHAMRLGKDESRR